MNISAISKPAAMGAGIGAGGAGVVVGGFAILPEDSGDSTAAMARTGLGLSMVSGGFVGTVAASSTLPRATGLAVGVGAAAVGAATLIALANS